MGIWLVRVLRSIVAGAVIAGATAGVIALITRWLSGHWGMYAGLVLLAEALLFAAAPKGAGGFVMLGGGVTPNDHWKIHAQAVNAEANLKEIHQDYLKRRTRGGTRWPLGLAGVFLLAVWLLLG